FGDQVSPQTGELLQRSLGSARYTSLAAALHTINEMGAKRRRRLVAVVTAATPLTEAQVRRLGEILTRSYGRKVQINVAVDPQVVGGMKIQIGDDVVDATTLGRLDEARRRLRSEEHTSELQSRFDLVCRLLLEKTNTDC